MIRHIIGLMALLSYELLLLSTLNCPLFFAAKVTVYGLNGLSSMLWSGKVSHLRPCLVILEYCLTWTLNTSHISYCLFISVKIEWCHQPDYSSRSARLFPQFISSEGSGDRPCSAFQPFCPMILLISRCLSLHLHSDPTLNLNRSWPLAILSYCTSLCSLSLLTLYLSYGLI